MTAIYAEATQDAAPLGLLREALDVASHGLRRRVCLGSDPRAGQVLAQAAPLAIAVATVASWRACCGSALYFQRPDLAGVLAPESAEPGQHSLTPLLWLAALAAVWTVARALVVPAMVLCLADVLLAASPPPACTAPPRTQ
ncbi:hypothetical protein ABZ687_13190 [Streptomyces ardesiacus]|uniref:hypothetical protein n=1 Tax=Streptomyces ardesiacus TaxID=285564 RepID=UPI00340F0F6B